MSVKILSMHEEIFDFLAKLHKKDKSFLFVPRKINKGDRLKNGYWFIGNDNYLQVSFWNGMDWKEKIHNIAFEVGVDGDSYIAISGQDSEEKAKFLHMLAKKLGNFEKHGNKNKWHREYKRKDYMVSLKNFLKKDKRVIDNLIKKHKPKDIFLPSETDNTQYIECIITLRNEQKKLLEINKIVRICWNTKGWKFPSGPLGKSRNPKSYEAKCGYGHEEWLFDKSRIIDGYHYAFLQPLGVKSGKHIGKTYNVSLYAINGSGKRFYVGDIKEVFCISEEEARKTLVFYKKKGWFKEMGEDIERIGANPNIFFKHEPLSFFNVKFRFEDVCMRDELEEISDEDSNLTTSRVVLLNKQTDFVIKEEISVDDESEGSLKNTARRKVVMNAEVEYDPYHDRMQNMLKEHLEESYKKEYDKVCIEKNRVDIKARTRDGKWHYFEIKTYQPKMCIRQSLGQIMEYAFWPDVQKAEKLIIIGDTTPDEEAVKYLRYIREKFNIPVYYKSFDMNKKTLSMDC